MRFSHYSTEVRTRRRRNNTVGPEESRKDRDRSMPKTKIKSKVRVEQKEDYLRNAPEVSIFLSCVAAVNQLRCLAAAYEVGEITRVAFSRQSTCVVADLSQLADATERFDIVCPVLEFGRFSPFFWRWFNWWNDFLKDLTARQVGHLEKLAREGRDHGATHRPQGDWVQYRHTPAFALVIT